MNNIRNYFVLIFSLVILSVGVACDTATSDNSGNTNGTQIPVNETPPIISNLPDIIGEPPDTVITMIGNPTDKTNTNTNSKTDTVKIDSVNGDNTNSTIKPSEPEYDTQYTYPWGKVQFKASKAVVVEVKSTITYNTATELLKQVGVNTADIKTAPQRQTETSVVYKNAKLNGVTYKELTVLAKKRGEFYLVVARID